MSKKTKRPLDPHATREAGNYEHPIASRELIAETLSSHAGPMGFDDLARALGLQQETELHALQRRLRAMRRDGEVVENRKGAFGVSSKMDLITGRVHAHKDGFGFLIRDDNTQNEPDLFLSSREMRALMHGDRALVRISNVDRRGRVQADVVEILERNVSQVVGRFTQDGALAYVTPDNRNLHHDVLIPKREFGGAKHGQIVVAEIRQQPSKKSQPVGAITEVLGDHMAPGMEVDVAIRSYDIPNVWPDPVADEMAGVPTRVTKSEREGRLDIRDLSLVTIDGSDARDFDDALYCERHAKGWRLYVAIADVSTYVRPGSALDSQAYERGNSVYFPDYVVPMLPEILSNGICSLVPKRDRLCMVCILDISPKGRVRHKEFHAAVMHSKARLTYEQVNRAVVDEHQPTRKKLSAVVPHLDELYALYQVLREQRVRRGAIDLETSEALIVLDEQRRVERIEPRTRNDAHRIVEECMISANVAAADFLVEQSVAYLSRAHEPPPDEKVAELRGFLGSLGLSMNVRGKPKPADFAAIAAEISKRPESALLHSAILRTLSQAQYAPSDVGHFGLALERYCHFTSPIRRYPDLTIHRAIRGVLQKSGDGPNAAALQSIGEHCSMTERRADEATRDAVSWLKCEYMSDKVGEVFSGLVSSVTSFGLFVQLDHLYVEGLIHVSVLGSDYFHFDPVARRLEGERTHVSFSLADAIMVRVARVDLDERRIDFELVTDRKKGAWPRRRKGGSPRGSARSKRHRRGH